MFSLVFYRKRWTTFETEMWSIFLSRWGMQYVIVFYYYAEFLNGKQPVKASQFFLVPRSLMSATDFVWYKRKNVTVIWSSSNQLVNEIFTLDYKRSRTRTSLVKKCYTRQMVCIVLAVNRFTVWSICRQTSMYLINTQKFDTVEIWFTHCYETDMSSGHCTGIINIFNIQTSLVKSIKKGK